MIQNFKFFENFELRNSTISEIMGGVADDIRRLLCDISCTQDNPIDITSQYERAEFNRKYMQKGEISINTKNIESVYSEYLSQQIMDDKTKKACDQLGVADVVIKMTVYRLGAFSYYVIECCALFLPEIERNI